MDMIKRAFSQFVKWLERVQAGWLALSYAARWLVLIGATFMFSKAVVLEQGPPNQFWAVASTLGTLIAAFAAYSTAAVTKTTLDNQLRQIEEEKRPWLIVSRAALIVEVREFGARPLERIGPFFYLTFTAANMSKSAMQIYQVICFSEAQVAHGVPQPAATQANDFVPPNEKVEVKVRANQLFYPGQAGEIYIFFYYGETGQRPHALKWTYKATRDLSEDQHMRSFDFDFFSVAEYMAPDAAVAVQIDIRRRHNIGRLAGRL